MKLFRIQCKNPECNSNRCHLEVCRTCFVGPCYVLTCEDCGAKEDISYDITHDCEEEKCETW